PRSPAPAGAEARGPGRYPSVGPLRAGRDPPGAADPSLPTVMRPLHARRRPNVPRPVAALLALGVLACSDRPLGGPGLPGRGASLRLEPRVAPRASVAAAGITRVRVAIARVPDGLVVLDSVVDLAGPNGAELDLAVPLASSSDRFAVRLAAADA